jgi:hypothetical protein
MSGEEELACLKAHLGELSLAVLRQMKRDILAERNRGKPRLLPRIKSRAKDPMASPPVWANKAVPAGGGGDCGLPEDPKTPLPRQASSNPMSWTRPTRAVRWNLPLGSRLPGYCPDLGPRLRLHTRRENPPKARWLNSSPPRANKPRKAADNWVTQRLVRRSPVLWPGDRLKEWLLRWIPRHRSPIKKGPLGRVKEAGTWRRPAELALFPSYPDVRTTSRWEPLLADTWTLSPPRKKAKWVA